MVVGGPSEATGAVSDDRGHCLESESLCIYTWPKFPQSLVIFNRTVLGDGTERRGGSGVVGTKPLLLLLLIRRDTRSR